MNEAVARRYASALADVALEQIKADRVKADFSSFVEAYYESADLRNFLETPAVGPEQKHKVIEKLAERMGLDPAVRNFVYLTSIIAARSYSAKSSTRWRTKSMRG